MHSLHGLTYNLNTSVDSRRNFKLPSSSNNLNSFGSQKTDCFFGSENDTHLSADSQSRTHSFLNTIRQKISPKSSPRRSPKSSPEREGKQTHSKLPDQKSLKSLTDSLSPEQQDLLDSVAGPSPKKVRSNFIMGLRVVSPSTLAEQQSYLQQQVKTLTSTWIEDDKDLLKKDILELFSEKNKKKEEWPLEIARFIIQPLG
jgi:hypothetical protein